jgi:hypothetical protein
MKPIIGRPPASLVDALSTAGQPRGVFQERQILSFLESSRFDWPLGYSTSCERQIAWLIQNTELRQILIESQQRQTPTVRYTWGDSSPFAIALSLARSPYFSHGTAAALQGLVPLSGPLYVNQEQTPKPTGRGILTQESINRAFRSPQRLSNNRHRWDGGSAVILSGKNTNSLGVGQTDAPGGQRVPTTSIERTLIDLAVRPAYCGGPTVVLDAFKAARGRASSGALMKTLHDLSYVYPYHQVIGFYLERSKYDRDTLEMFKEPGIRLDFYVDYGLVEPSYDQHWRVFYPSSLTIASSAT